MAKIKSKKNGTRKEAIIEEAALLFHQKGFNATSMRDLAEQVGVEAASLYNHIQSKSEILQEICFQVANEFSTHFQEIEQQEASHIEKVERVLRFHIRQMVENYTYVNVADREWRHLPDPYLSNYQHQRRVYRKRFAALIEAGIEAGEIREVDAPTAVLIMLHAVSGIESWHRSRQKISAADLEKNMVLLLIQGMKGSQA